MNPTAIIRMPGEGKEVTLAGQPMAFLVTGDDSKHTRSTHVCLIGLCLIGQQRPVTAAQSKTRRTPQSIMPINFTQDTSTAVEGFTHNYTQIEGLKLHYVSGGEGPAVLLIPGWPQRCVAACHAATCEGRISRHRSVGVRMVASLRSKTIETPLGKRD
jgi:hypothetical protein